MNLIRKSSKLVMLAFVMLLLASGCKSKKKAMEAAAAEKARMEQEAARKREEAAAARKKEEEERARKEAEARDREAAASTPKAKLTQYFDAITSAANSTSANNSINEALAMFASPDTPVLIVISESGGEKDYDRPTTIRNYLNYLKDQKKNMNKVSNLQFDASGKITEVELKKE
ncbi:MAG TPA: nucleoid-structuring protein H-NS [Chryseosolibacter sp.]|nr:nucleoid-structuring protein H-NS [Chryseosolibacter sp.]